MISRKSRLPVRELHFNKRETLITQYFSLKMRTNHGTRDRIGVIAGLAVGKNAAKRNFWKRQAKAILTEIPPSGRDILVILSPKTNTLTKKEFKKTLLGSVAQFSNFPS